MKTLIRNLLVVPAMLLAGVAAAHHSAVQFDFGKSVTYTGVVKDFAAINPHMRLVIELPGADGKGSHTVRFEGHSTNNMYRQGYRKGSVKVGDRITVTAAPYKDGTEGGYVIGAQVDGGEFFGMRPRGARPQDVQAAGEEVRRQAEGR